MVVGKVPLFLGYTTEHAEMRSGKITLALSGKDGSKKEVSADHVIAATGYKVDLERLKFLSSQIRTQLKGDEETLPLSSSFESSVPGIYFVGVAAADSFGPLMRFAFGAGFAARCVTNAVGKSLSRDRAFVAAPNPVSTRNEESEKNQEAEVISSR
jgi:pyruvate/2-oxoglutarate dehydrogenase complex dihydrolipoamide dehydrogenase (E3) component